MDDMQAEPPNRNRYLIQCVPLHRAALKGDWKAAEALIKNDSSLVRARVTKNGETALHIAAGARHVFFVKKLLAGMNENDVEIQNVKGVTALCLAATTGNVKIARLMVDKNRELPTIGGVRPLYMATLSGHSDMVDYLYERSSFETWAPPDQIDVLANCIHSGLYGAALKILEYHPQLAVAEDGNYQTPLCMLARKPSAFVGGSQLELRRRIINTFPCMKFMQTEAHQLLKCLWNNFLQQEDLEIQHISQNTSELLFVAAELGNDEFLVELLHRYPDFLYNVNNSKQSIFHIAVLHRHERIFNLIYEIGMVKDLIASFRDGEDNNILHLAAKLAPLSQLNAVSGAALQMQRELLWYKEVEKMVHPTDREMKNSDGQTPHDLFTTEHQDLMKEGETWMKKTAESCMLVATLIPAIVFTNAFTVPGGYDNTTGAPILLKQRFFAVFFVSVAIALLSASTSILMFLSILTSRYAENDFLKSLPIRLMIGVATLFISIVAMMVAFCTAFLLSDHHGWAQPPVVLGLLTAVLIIFISLKSRLLVDVVHSTYSSRLLFRSRNRLFH